MKTVTEYTAFTASTVESLLPVVRKAITEGWQPLGGMILDRDKYHSEWYQNMVKYEKMQPKRTWQTGYAGPG